jgi:hypothetical protein
MKLKMYPEKLQPFIFHGVDLNYNPESTMREVIGDCPLCGKEEKFYANKSNGLYHCKVCGSEGNVYTFIRELHALLLATTTDGDYEDIMDERPVLTNITVLRNWGLAWNPSRKEWLLPAYNQEGQMTNLYRYALITTKKGEKHRFLSTPTLANALFGLPDDTEEIPRKDAVVFCEGPWDGMALDCSLHEWVDAGSVLIPIDSATKDEDTMDVYYNVRSVPGIESFNQLWGEITTDRDAIIMFDSDHPRQHPTTGKEMPPAGHTATKKVAAILSQNKANDLLALEWGPEGYDEDEATGFDVSDMLHAYSFPDLWDLIVDVPEHWVEEGKKSIKSDDELELLDCTEYSQLKDAWEDALQWTPSLNTTLSSMLATVASTKLQGDQLWLRVIGPPGSAKSTLCEAITTNRQYVKPISVQKGFHSGYKGSKEDAGKDSSLIPRIDGKTVITKDGDTLLASPNVAQILSEMRDFYDGTSRADYKNFKSSAYTGLRITFILAGTKSLRRLNKSYLGDRFIDCIIYDRGEQNFALEQEILVRAASNALKRVRSHSSPDVKKQQDPAMTKAMQLTGGYVQYLRQNVEKLIKEVNCPEWVLTECIKLGEIVSCLRARPDKELEAEDQEVELPTRLTSQFVRLANTLAVVWNKRQVDEEVMSAVRKVATDTGRGITMSILDALYESNDGLSCRQIALRLATSEATIRRNVAFLKTIGVVKGSAKSNNSGARGRKLHVFTIPGRIVRLYEALLDWDQADEEEDE